MSVMRRRGSSGASTSSRPLPGPRLPVDPDAALDARSLELDASISSLERRVEEIAGAVLGRDGALCLDEASVDALAEVMTPRLKARRRNDGGAGGVEGDVPGWRRPQTSAGRMQQEQQQPGYDSVDAMLRVNAWDTADGIEGLNLSGFLQSTVELAAAEGSRGFRRRRDNEGADGVGGVETEREVLDASTSVGGLPGAHRLTHARPPYWAVDCYMTVAAGRGVSLSDGETQYRAGWTTEASGGQGVYANPRDCLSQVLVDDAKGVQVAKCLAWNVDRMQEPVRGVDGKRLVYECVHVVALLPHPESGALAERRHKAAAEGFRGAASLSPRGAGAGTARPKTSGGRLSGSSAEAARLREQGGRSDALLALQAESVALSAEVAEAERSLGLRGAKVRAAINAPSEAPWPPSHAPSVAPAKDKATAKAKDKTETAAAPPRPSSARKSVPVLAAPGNKPSRAGALRRPLGPAQDILTLDVSNVLRGTEIGKHKHRTPSATPK